MLNIRPSLGEFLGIPHSNNLVVFSYKFYCDYLTPVSIYYRMAKFSKAESFLLESVEGEEKISRFSFIGAQPLVIVKSRDRKIYINKGGEKRIFTTHKDPLYELKKLMGEFKLWPKEYIRFFGGFVGYVGYDVIKFYEPIGKLPPKEINSFDSYFILPKFLIVFDHLKKQIEVLSFFFLEDKKGLKKIYRREVGIIKTLIDYILVPAKLLPLHITKEKLSNKSKFKVTSNFRRSQFIDAVKKIKHYIKNGEIIQAVLSQRISAPFSKDPFLVYRYLRFLNPSPYMYYLNFRGVKIVGSSPEMLLRCEGGKLITRPIAGTRRRGKDEEEDKRLVRDLLGDEKERAEHLMLVDLGRNDLGRVAKKGSVNVPVFMSIEKFSHVMHIVSEVQGRLDRGKDMFGALRACFPAGTVTGAPKVRAMQIINELEPSRRGIYAGCIGYFSFTNSLDTCIIIRTIIFINGYAYIQAGAGIVADSKPQREYRETMNKAYAQILALKMAY